jgi:hypothetical protein
MYSAITRHATTIRANACRTHVVSSVITWEAEAILTRFLHRKPYQPISIVEPTDLHRLHVRFFVPWRMYISHCSRDERLHPKVLHIYSLMYFFNPLNLSFACSSTSSSLQIANLNQSSARCAFSSVKNSVGGMAATPSSMMQNHMSLKSRGRSATWGGKG